MQHQVLARKWRPQRFAELVGQHHVKQALVNGLNQGRLHHAYLFTGTRGVGKTTIARIFAKSLNCDLGVTAEPCGQCPACVDIEAGRFVDLIEIDAASRTKVEDTREILDNIHYAPTRGRYKVYLIDEVHMLSRSSFNALLKTLEEPPPHIKFLLATTDPQKLPITILSRCLQFNLRAMDIDEISQQLRHVLQQEAIPFSEAAIAKLAKAARGSMRDALSLTDQAIAQSNGDVQLDVVQQMLGTLSQQWSAQLLTAIAERSVEQLAQLQQQLHRQHVNYFSLLDDLLSLCHCVAMTQLVPTAAQMQEELQGFVQQFAAATDPLQIHTWYQLLLTGKRDLQWAPEPSLGFDMLLLRLLAFEPANGAVAPKKSDARPAAEQMAQIKALLQAKSADEPSKAPRQPTQEHSPAPTPLPENSGQSLAAEPRLPISAEPTANPGAVARYGFAETDPQQYQQAVADELNSQLDAVWQQAAVQMPDFAPAFAAEAHLAPAVNADKPVSTPAVAPVAPEEAQELSAIAAILRRRNIDPSAVLANAATKIAPAPDVVAPTASAQHGSVERNAPSVPAFDEAPIAPSNTPSSPVSAPHGHHSEWFEPEALVESSECDTSTAPSEYVPQAADDELFSASASTSTLASTSVSASDSLTPLAQPQTPSAPTTFGSRSEYDAQVEDDDTADNADAEHDASHQPDPFLPFAYHGEPASAEPQETLPLAAAAADIRAEEVAVEYSAPQRHHLLDQLQPKARAAEVDSAEPEEIEHDESEVDDLALPEQFSPLSIDDERVRLARQVDYWAYLIDRMGLGGRMRQFAVNSIVQLHETRGLLVASEGVRHLYNPTVYAELQRGLSQVLAHQVELDVQWQPQVDYCPAHIQQQIAEIRLARAQQRICQDPVVQQLQHIFAAELDMASIKAC